MEVIAEGWEKEMEAEEMGLLGCDYGQGVALGEPMTIEECRALFQPSAVPEPRRRARA